MRVKTITVVELYEHEPGIGEMVETWVAAEGSDISGAVKTMEDKWANADYEWKHMQHEIRVWTMAAICLDDLSEIPNMSSYYALDNIPGVAGDWYVRFPNTLPDEYDFDGVTIVKDGQWIYHEKETKGQNLYTFCPVISDDANFI